MASYDVGGFAAYQINTSSGATFYEGVTVTSATLDDLDGGIVWTEGETVLNYSSTPSNDYLGKISVDLVGGGSMVLPIVRGLAAYTDPNVIQVLIVYPAAMSASEFVFPDPIDYASRSTDDFTVCFAAGTGISTPDGDRPVESLSIGDVIYNAQGDAVPVRWIGQQTVFPVFAGPRSAPVRILAGALGSGLPHTDLTVTADHGMIVEGLVINAGALVNGDSIAFVPLAELPESVTYYHVETENHDVILANGAPAETFIDYVGRRVFDNHAEYVALYGCERIIPEMTRPRISTARLLPEAIRARLGIGMRVVA